MSRPIRPFAISTNRRSFIRYAVLSCGALATGWSRAPAGAAVDTSTSAVVETTAGKVRGARDRGSFVFKGVPYARTPGRLAPPAPPVPWTHVRDALHYGPRSFQVDVGAPRAAPGARDMSEQCQVLNLWTPALDNGKRPVMLWLHGGGFTSGSASRPTFDGTSLNHAHDVVVVTINHRLASFGYLYLGDGLDELGNTSLAGSLDIVAALAWIRDNIAAFGGDPQRVTIFGNSGGGGKVMTLMAMPAAHGLFHRAIVQSGTIHRTAATPEQGLRFTHSLLKELSLPPNQPRALLNVPAEALLRAQAAVQARIGYDPERATLIRPFSPVLDAAGLPEQPFDPRAPSVSAHVPMIVGTDRDETRVFHGRNLPIYNLAAADLPARLEPIMGARTREAIELYSTTRPEASPSDLYFAISTAQMYWACALRTAEIKALQSSSVPGGASVYMYQYAYDSGQPVGKSGIPLRAAHSTEVPLVFNHPLPPPGKDKPTDESLRVAREISGAWTAFARDGSPNASGLTKWSPYSAENRATMWFGTPTRSVDDPDATERRWWQDPAQQVVWKDEMADG